jgi:uncharacterized protein
MRDLHAPDQKYNSLLDTLRSYGGVLLSFSGGVDSSFLLKALQQAGVKTLAVTAVSETMPTQDRDDAVSLAGELGIEHLVINTAELANEDFARNAQDRCFHCKNELFERLSVLAAQRGLPVVCDGSNQDDLSDFRPGRKAAEAHGVRSPLAACGLSKDDIRMMSRRLGLSTWDKPSSPCLSSRFPYGTRITAAGLDRVRKAEDILRGLGIHIFRVRDHGETARIEVGQEEMSILMEEGNRRLVVDRLHALGYNFVCLDLEGYRTGSLNRGLGRP